MTDDRIELFDDEEEEEVISLEDSSEDLITLDDSEDYDKGERDRDLSPELIILEEDVDDNVLDMFISDEDLSNIEVIELEDEDQVYDDSYEEDEDSYRLGLEDTPSETIKEFLSKYVHLLENIQKASGFGHMERLGNELSTMLLNSVDMDFLTARQQSQLIIYVTGYKDKEEIISSFLKSENLKPSARFQIERVVTQMMNSFNQIQNRIKIRKSIEEKIVKLILKDHITLILSDLEEMSKYIDSEDAVYVSKIYASINKVQYTCGSCSEVNESDRDFVTLLIHENVSTKGERVLVFPSGKRCSKCGKLNILTRKEHEKISRVLNKKYEKRLESWFSKSTEKLTKSTNVITYFPGKLTDINPSLYKDMYRDGDSDTISSNMDFSVVHKWYKETVSLLERLPFKPRYSKKVFKDSEGYMEVDYSNMYNMLDNVAKIYCSMFNENYRSLRSSSITTILMYLKANPVLLNSITVVPELSYEVLTFYKDYLGKDLGESTEEVYENIMVELGVTSPDFYSNGTVNLDKREEIDKELSKAIEEAKRRAIEIKENRERALDYLTNTLPMFRFMDIRFISMQGLEEVKAALVDERVVNWINWMSILMTLNRISDKIREHWSSLKVEEVRNRSLFNPKSTKPFKEVLDRLLKRYTNIFHDAKSSPMGNLSEFLSREFYSMEIFSTIRELKESIDRVDLYGFYFSIVELDDKFNYNSSAFRPIKDLINAFRREANEFVRGKDNSLEEWYKFTYSDQFTGEEIEEGLGSVSGKIKKPYTLIRLEGETFSEYLSRLQESKFDSKTCKVDPNVSIFRRVNAFVPGVYAVFEFYNYIVSNKNTYRDTLLISDVVMYSFMFGEEYMYKFLGIYPATRVLDIKAKTLEVEDFEKLKAEFFMSNITYPSSELNSIRIGDDDLDGSGYRNVVDYANSNRDEYLEKMGHLKDLREYLDEYYFDRVDKASNR